MKKISLLLLSILTVGMAMSQEKTLNFSKHFMTFRVGYSIPVASSQIGSPRPEVGDTYVNEVLNTSGGTVSYSEKNSFGSRGAGLNISLGYGYMITENFSFEFDANFVKTFGTKDAFINTSDVTNKVVYKASQNSETTMFRVTPMFGVYANENALIRPYAKFGILLPLAGGTSVDLSIEDNTGVAFNDLMPVIDPLTVAQTQQLASDQGIINLTVPTKTDIKAVTSGSFSVGFMARLGAEYKFKNVANGKLKIFAEMEMQMLTVKAHKTEIKEFNSTVNDATFKMLAENAGIKTAFGINDIPEVLKHTEYVKEVTENSNSYYNGNTNYDRNKALEDLSFRDNYNAFGFMIGLKYGF